MTDTFILKRKYLPDCTIGELRDASNNALLCYTLEEPNDGNKQGVSCIPEGEYFCKHWDGNKFKDVWNVAQVPSRTAILIHNGNTVIDIEGCILVGVRKGFTRLAKDTLEKGKIIPKGTLLQAVFDSKVALSALKEYIGRDKNKKLNTFILKITS